MCEKFEITKSIAMRFIATKNRFTINQLKDEIIDAGGGFRISSRQSLNDFLDTFIDRGYMNYSEKEDEYIVNCRQ